MFSGESAFVDIKTTSGMMSELVDWFGTDFRVIEKNEEFIIARVKCNYTAMRFWSLQYGPYVEILKPDSLREQLQDERKLISWYAYIWNSRTILKRTVQILFL